MGRAGEFRSIRDINLEVGASTLLHMRRCRMYCPTGRAYDQKYSTQIRGGEASSGKWLKADSPVARQRAQAHGKRRLFALTVHRQQKDVEAVLAQISAHPAEIEELDITNVDVEDPTFESLLVGRKVRCC